ncbi:MAG: prepilin-type N-terminal cleavage/methylation domain-containing protein, partial [Candidatus Falkowbacteria bacterium]
MLIKHKQFGFTLIEVLVSVLTLSILIVGVYNLLIYSLQITTDNKNRMGAIMIADQKAEYVRNLPYDDVGTVAGIVTGVMQDNETVSANNGTFNVNIFVQYEDDPYDGTLGGAPDDILPTDYKQVRIRVSWSGPFGTKNVTTFTKIAPRGMETSAGGGVLTVLVFDSNGLPINDASVHIENNILATPINFDAETSANGILNLPGAPESIEGYEITVTKAGYSTDYTSARVVGVNDNPTKPHSTVLENQRTNVSFAIDLLSVLTIEAVTASMPRNWPGSHDTSGETQSNGRIAIDNSSFVYVVWDDYRSASAAKIYTQKHDSIGNAQWPDTSSPSDINIATANNTVIPDVLVDSFGNLYISWHDDSVGNKEAYLSKRDSSDGSDLWGSGKRINTIADSAHQSYPRIALMDDGITATTTAVWQDDRNTDWDIFMQIFDYDGDYQLSPESRVNTNGLFDGSDQYEPVVVADLSYNIYISWTDDRNGNLDIYAQKYGIDGVSLWAPDLLCNNDGGATDQYSPDIAMDSLGNIYIVW